MEQASSDEKEANAFTWSGRVAPDAMSPRGEK